MLSDNIVLFEINGYFVLIDNYTLNMFLLNESTFAVLKEMKSGGTRKEAEIRFGKNKVDKISMPKQLLRKSNLSNQC